MSLVTQIKNELSQLGIKPKKSLGQNFLINEAAYAKIVSALDIKSGDKIVEVGPGLGTLTQYLADTGAEVLAVEKDETLARYLRQKFKNKKNVKIAVGDVLRFRPEAHGLEAEKYKVAGNIPYYLTSHLFKTVFESWPIPSILVMMLQKEVAQRITAKPPKMSLLAVSVQYYAQPSIVSYVSHGSFYPPPEVDSAIIKLESKEHLPTNEDFFRIVKIGFAGKRKQLGNNLAGGLKLKKGLVEEKLKSIGIDSKRRAETLTLNEWQSIATTLLQH